MNPIIRLFKCVVRNDQKELVNLLSSWGINLSFDDFLLKPKALMKLIFPTA